MSTVVRASLLALVLTCLLATASSAQRNQLTNESFDDDVSGWTPSEAWMSVAHDSDDVDGDEDSGSAQVVFNPTIEISPRGHVGQCVEVNPGNTYTGSTSFRIPTMQNRTGSAGMRVEWHTSTDCSGPSPSFGFGNTSSFEGAWADLNPAQFVAPNNVFSGEVQLQINKPQQGGTLVIFFDEVMFVPEPTPGVAGLVALAMLLGIARRG